MGPVQRPVGDWASGHLILQPDAEVVPTASEAGVDSPAKPKGRKRCFAHVGAVDSQPHNGGSRAAPYPGEL